MKKQGNQKKIAALLLAITETAKMAWGRFRSAFFAPSHSLVFKLTFLLSILLSFPGNSQTINLCTGGAPSSCDCAGFYKTAGSTTVSGNAATLTASSSQGGALWQCDCFNLNNSFTISFKLNFGSNTSAGDGIAFVIQDETDSPQILGGKGGGMGYAQGDGNCIGSSANCPIDRSIAVEFDTYNNGSITDDPIGMGDHVAVYSNGIQSVSNRIAAPTELKAGGATVKDGADHYVQISWNASTNLFTVYFDGELKISVINNIRTYALNPPTCTKWGFTASSGGFAQTHRVSNICMNVTKPTITASSSTVCAGGSVTLTSSSASSYIWSNGATTQSINVTSAGNYTVIATETGGCTPTSDQVTITSSGSAPTTSFTATSPVAIHESSTITYTGNALANASYSWNFNGGTIVSGSGQGPYLIKWSTSGTKNITLSITQSGCTTTTSTSVPVTVSSNISYDWNGSSNNNWSTSSNWTPNGIPGVNDYVNIGLQTRSPVLGSNVGVTRLSISSGGEINLNGNTLSISGIGSFAGGTINSGNINLSCSQVTFGGTIFNTTLSATCSDIFLNGSTFNQPASFVKTGSGGNLCIGGNVYNSAASITNTGLGTLTLANTAADEYYGNATFAKTTCGSALFGGSNPQSINNVGSDPLIFNSFTINKPGNGLTLNTPIYIASGLIFTKGIIYTTETNIAVFNDGATASGASNDSYVDGPVGKIGRDPFTFPIGKNNFYRYVSISSPSNNTDYFSAQYFNANSHDSFSHTNKPLSINHLSRCEYWMINKSAGASPVYVTLSWNTNSCGVNDPYSLIVCRHNGVSWENHGGVISNNDLEKITSSSPISSFSPFTLGSTTSDNPMPVKISFFNVKEQDGKAKVSWTSNETSDIKYYYIQKSRDLIAFEEVGKVETKGSELNKYYQFIDFEPYNGDSYYRLKHVSQSGAITLSDVAPLSILSKKNTFSIFPNPFNNSFKVKHENGFGEKVTVRISNVNGKVIYNQVHSNTDDYSIMEVELRDEKPGIYLVEMKTKTEVIKKIVIKE